MKTFYHVTPKKNIKSIMKYGLIPKIGSRSKKLKEERCVFLFPSIEVMECALEQWFGECFSEKTTLAALEVAVPDDFPIQDSTVGYEKVSKIPIPPAYIKMIFAV